MTEPKVAAYFEVGDVILYGKYKNKKGRIIEFTQDKKGNPLVTIEPIPKGRKQNKTMGLFKIWKQQIEKVALRVAARYAATVVRKLGTCGVCLKAIKVPNNLLALHGYSRPGYGYIQGRCPGSGHLPWEVSPITGEIARDYFQGLMNQLSKDIQKLTVAEELTFDRGSFGRAETFHKKDLSEVQWNSKLEEKRGALERSLNSVSISFAQYDKAVKNWKAQTVKEVTELQEQQDRQQKQDAVRATRLERYEGLKKKALDRLSKTWNNLKQREAKARAKPTAKNFIEVAKAANIIYQIYEGVSKLAEAHPERSFRPVDVLEELQMDHIWKHMGVMEGGVYKDRKALKAYRDHAYSGSLGWDFDFPSLKDFRKEPDVSKDWRPNWPGFKALV